MTRRHLVHGTAAGVSIASLGLAAFSTLGGASAATVVPSAPLAPLSRVVSTPTTLLSAVASSALKATTSSGTTTTTTVVPAPASSASATGLRVGIIDTCISCTSAKAGPTGGSGTGTALRVLGTDIAAGQTTGAEDSGALIALPLDPVLSLAIADWEESVRHAGGGTQSHARTALVDLSVAGGQVATVTVLQSISDATYTPGVSTGHASNDGAIVNLGNGALVIVLLHSEAGSDGTAHAYVASINGNELLPSSSAGIPITIPGVTTITLLQAGATGGTASALVAQASDTVLLGAGENLLGLGAQASGAKAPAAPVAAPAPASAPAPVAPVTGIEPSVPNTGAATAAGLALLLIGTGAAASAIGRRRRRTRWVTAKD